MLSRRFMARIESDYALSRRVESYPDIYLDLNVWSCGQGAQLTGSNRFS